MNYKQFKFHFDSLAQLFSLLITFGETFIVLLYVWILAYIDPQKAMIIYVDKLGEAVPELFLWIVLIPYCTYGMYLNIKMLLKYTKLTERRIYKYL